MRIQSIWAWLLSPLWQSFSLWPPFLRRIIMRRRSTDLRIFTVPCTLMSPIPGGRTCVGLREAKEKKKPYLVGGRKLAGFRRLGKRREDPPLFLVVESPHLATHSTHPLPLQKRIQLRRWTSCRRVFHFERENARGDAPRGPFSVIGTRDPTGFSAASSRSARVSLLYPDRWCTANVQK